MLLLVNVDIVVVQKYLSERWCLSLPETEEA
jgi:hypothetical protein